MWPLVKKQLTNTKALRRLQPELKRIKQETKGDRQRESMLTMELYKEQGISPFSSLGTLLIQLPIFIGLFMGLNKIIHDPKQIVEFSYPFIQNLGWMKQLAGDISLFDQTFLGAIDLHNAALNSWGIYWPAMVIVVGSAVVQYYQSKQLMPNDGTQRRLRDILRGAQTKAEVDQGEVNAATQRMMTKMIPIMVLLFTIRVPSALSLYWLVSGLVAMVQQAKALEDEEVILETAMHKDDNKKTTTQTKPASGRKHIKSKARVVSITTEGKKK